MDQMTVCVVKNGDLFYKGKYKWSKSLNNKTFFTRRAAKWHKTHLSSLKENRGKQIDIIEFELTNGKIL